MITRSAKYLLQPTKGQARRLDHLLWQQRLLYNRALEERRSAWKNEGRSVTKFQQFAGLNGMADTDPDLAQYGAQVARGTLMRLDRAYVAFYRRCRAGESPGYPRVKRRTRWTSVHYPCHGGWTIKPDARRLRLMGIGHVKVRLHRGLPGSPSSLCLKREGTRWWVIVQCHQELPAALPDTGRQVGIDLGVSSIVTTSDGDHLANPRFSAKAAKRLAEAQRDLARKVKWSGRRRKAVARVAANHRRVANCRRDLAHQTSRRLVNGFDIIVHEDLSIANMMLRPTPRPNGDGTYQPNGATAKSGLNRSIQDAGWGQLLRFIAYKAEEAGREVIAVDPRNTSRTCSACGHCEKANRLTQAKFLCLSCGFRAHADENAAVNILRAGLALHRNECEVREEVGS